MSVTGATIRWSRFVNSATKRGIIVPVDHGLTYGPLQGMTSARQLASWIGHPAINGIIAHKGMVERLARSGALGRAGVMIHLNGMSALGETPDQKEMLTTVEAALRLGADAISVQLNFLPSNYAHNLTLLGRVVDQAHSYGLPVLVMAYDKTRTNEGNQIARMRHIMRTCYELGVDAIKTEAPENHAEIPLLLEGIASDVAVFFSGGALAADDRLPALAQAAVEYGAAGLCVGRNVFQRPDPTTILLQLQEILGS